MLMKQCMQPELCKATPSPYADHDHISTKVLSGQRE